MIEALTGIWRMFGGGKLPRIRLWSDMLLGGYGGSRSYVSLYD